MVAVTGFAVLLTLKDGSVVEGTVKRCADQQLTLETGEGPFTVPGTGIAELKVVDVPSHLKRKKKNKEANNKRDKETMKTSAAAVKDTSRDTRKDVFGNVNGRDTFEDTATRIHSSGDFDFAQSTADFNKHSALREFVEQDTVDSGDRLVGHNKTKTKFSHTEMVLGDDNVNTTASDAIKSMLQVKVKPAAAAANAASDAVTTTASADNGLPETLATPLQLLQAETTTVDTYAHPPILLTENAAIGVSGIVLKVLGGSSRFNTHNAPPTILVIVGNNKTGARGVATARHLLNKGANVLLFIAVAGEGEEEDQDVQLTEQLALYRAIKGVVYGSLQELQTAVELTLPELVVDALQGYDTNISDLLDPELSQVVELIRWVNGLHVSALSLDVPSGIDAGSGEVTAQVVVESKYVVSLGLAMVGLRYLETDWRHYVVDLGIPKLVFAKGSLRKFSI
jgi:enhancer of mRNA-decapping protein 3